MSGVRSSVLKLIKEKGTTTGKAVTAVTNRARRCGWPKFSHDKHASFARPWPTSNYVYREQASEVSK